jgi:ectoine hydroxylase-related dioxygenase (phytanoyl-CoA dioxygenase family)
MFVLFPPQVVHEVSANRSGATRLSIGMNLGVRPARNDSG